MFGIIFITKTKFIMLLRTFFLFIFSFLFFLQSYQQNSLKKDIVYLASNKLEGRYPGSIGDSLTQKYISNRFYKFNISPFIKNNSYAQKFEYIDKYYFESKIIVKNRFNEKKQISNNNFRVMHSENINISDVECVFIGYGTDSSCLSKIKNKVVITYLSYPLPYNKETKMFIKKNRISMPNLIKAGAKAIINITSENVKFSKHKIKKVYNHRENNDSIIILSLKKNDLNLFISKKEINYYDSILYTNPSVLPVFINSTSTINVSIKRHDKKIETANIIGLKKGSSNDFIIIGAHHDHLGKGKKNNLFYYGANDNASGVATLLYLTEKLSNIPLNCNILFIAFGAEERGLIGSKYFVKNLPIKKENIKAMINIDVIGKLKNNTLYYAKYNNCMDIEKNKKITNKSNILLHKKDCGLSDCASFFSKSIPILYFSTCKYEEYHTVRDTEKIINYPGIKKTSEFIFNVIKVLDNYKANKMKN